MTAIRSARESAAVVLCVLISVASPAAAQPEAIVDRSQNRACTEAIPATSMSPVVVYVGVDLPTDTASLRARPAAQVLTSRVAHLVRRRVGSTGQNVGSGEPMVRWQGAGAALRVTAYRDGRVTTWPTTEDTVVNAGARLLAWGIAADRDSGGSFAWPPSLTQDSVIVTLQLHTPMVSRSGEIVGVKADQIEPLFQVMQPWIEPAQENPRTFPRFPRQGDPPKTPRSHEFHWVIDSTGRVDMTTVREIWPENEPQPTGSRTRFEEASVKSIMDYFSRARFEPMRIGGCRVRQPTMLKFQFQRN
jgi:hypothetical protein